MRISTESSTECSLISSNDQIFNQINPWYATRIELELEFNDILFLRKNLFAAERRRKNSTAFFEQQ